MGYVLAKIRHIDDEILYRKSSKIKAAIYLSKCLNISVKLAQRLCDQGRVYSGKIFDENNALNMNSFRLVLDADLNAIKSCYQLQDETISNLKQLTKSDEIKDEIFIIIYAAVALNLAPVYENDDFVVFNKPNGLLTHPNGRNSEICLSDDLWFRYGPNACVVHRLDAPTSGLILCAKNQLTAKELKEIMQNRAVKKEYLLLARGHFSGDFCVHLPLGLDSDAKDLKNKMHVAKPFGKVSGKIARSEFSVLEQGFYKAHAASLLRCNLLTGRQHQIRAHLAAIDSAVLGDTLYGVSKQQARDHLDKKVILDNVDGASRLMLHSAYLKFSYKNNDYEFNLPAEFALDERL